MTTAEIRAMIRQEVANAIGVGIVAASSPDGHGEEIAGPRNPDEPGAPSYQIPVRRIQPFGLRSRAPAGCEAVFINPTGGATKSVMVGAESAKYGPANLADGEVEIYCAANGARVWLDKNGAIHIDAASGQDIILNGGTAKVARVGDHISGHQHAPGTLMCPNTGGGTPVAITGLTASKNDTIVSTDGAANVKG